MTYEELERAVDQFFGDKSRSQGATRDGLERIAEKIEMLIDSLEREE